MATPFTLLSLSPIRNPNFPQFITFSPIPTFPPAKSPVPKPYDPNFSTPKSSTIRRRRLYSSTNLQFLLSEATPIEDAAEIIPQNGDTTSTVVSALLFAAFVGLSILTIGVIYIAVTDFLQKRERDKFEKEEAAAAGKKKRGRKGVAATRPRGGPRGFGQKFEEDDDLDST